MKSKLHDWLSLGYLSDQGDRRGLYPYPLLQNILTPDDCRNAALNETADFEREFGADLVEPFYDLLWQLNTISDIFTSHSTVSPPDYRSPYPWATAYVGAAVIILPRKQMDRHNQHAADGMARQLVRVIETSPIIPTDTTGWQIRVFPTVMDLAYETGLANPEGVLLASERQGEFIGYGHELVVSGSAGNRRRAAERWSRAVQFVCQTLGHIPQAQPFQHYEIVNGQRAIPIEYLRSGHPSL